ncbi:hypothetical protein BDZ91DRAFT_835413 [Kalaharituber pfeilii]|nr:hypothetical protein BDZ91DRAFT_835413 [Kalaharituber pfeilii]
MGAGLSGPVGRCAGAPLWLGLCGRGITWAAKQTVTMCAEQFLAFAPNVDAATKQCAPAKHESLFKMTIRQMWQLVDKLSVPKDKNVSEMQPQVMVTGQKLQICEFAFAAAAPAFKALRQNQTANAVHIFSPEASEFIPNLMVAEPNTTASESSQSSFEKRACPSQTLNPQATTFNPDGIKKPHVSLDPLALEFRRLVSTNLHARSPPTLNSMAKPFEPDCIEKTSSSLSLMATEFNPDNSTSAAKPLSTLSTLNLENAFNSGIEIDTLENSKSVRKGENCIQASEVVDTEKVDMKFCDEPEKLVQETGKKLTIPPLEERQNADHAQFTLIDQDDTQHISSTVDIHQSTHYNEGATKLQAEKTEMFVVHNNIGSIETNCESIEIEVVNEESLDVQTTASATVDDQLLNESEEEVQGTDPKENEDVQSTPKELESPSANHSQVTIADSGENNAGAEDDDNEGQNSANESIAHETDEPAELCTTIAHVNVSSNVGLEKVADVDIDNGQINVQEIRTEATEVSSQGPSTDEPAFCSKKQQNKKQTVHKSKETNVAVSNIGAALLEVISLLVPEVETISQAVDKNGNRRSGLDPNFLLNLHSLISTHSLRKLTEAKGTIEKILNISNETGTAHSSLISDSQSVGPASEIPIPNMIVLFFPEEEPIETDDGDFVDQVVLWKKGSKNEDTFVYIDFDENPEQYYRKPFTCICAGCAENRSQGCYERHWGINPVRWRYHCNYCDGNYTNSNGCDECWSCYCNECCKAKGGDPYAGCKECVRFSEKRKSCTKRDWPTSFFILTEKDRREAYRLHGYHVEEHADDEGYTSDQHKGNNNRKANEVDEIVDLPRGGRESRMGHRAQEMDISNGDESDFENDGIHITQGTDFEKEKSEEPLGEVGNALLKPVGNYIGSWAEDFEDDIDDTLETDIGKDKSEESLDELANRLLKPLGNYIGSWADDFEDDE